MFLKILNIIPFTLILSLSFGQIVYQKIDYRYEMKLPEGGEATFFWTLRDNGKVSRFVIKEPDENTIKTQARVDKNDPGVYYDKLSNQLYMYYPIFNKSYFIKEDSLSNNFRWTIVNSEKKKILDFDCSLATCEFRGRNYRVYFTDELLFFSGPWKLTGLPGTILYAETEDGNFKYEAYKISLNGSDSIISNPYQNLKVDFLTFREHKSILLKKLKDLQKKVQSDEKEEDVEYGVEDLSIERLP